MTHSNRPPRTPVWPAFKTLWKELGLWRTFRVASRLRKREKVGEPFAELAPPANRDERLSREQIGLSILLYRELCKLLPKDDALATTEKVVAASGVVFMRRALGRLDRQTLESMDDAERRAFVEAKDEQFFNATMQWDHIGDDEVRFTVTACLFPGLCAAAGAPELARFYCDVDAAFFGSVEPDVELERKKTIAAGDDCCVFRLAFRDKQPN